LKREHLLL